ncbi:hypothetical protein [Flavobacterium taihuense]|uniref:DUF4105 domain-containing protein n=1 Tax=Flavobacterium taihuense TaxID=2857508 RepID=A0ABS6XSI2_9FLAO|nr:hypothetical protein [Flavobacterium taihuense]MBW4359630.1 hypothetical protein [Flavobacterium taihuense]
MKKILKYSVCFLMLFLVSCNNEEIAKNTENANLNQVKNDLELDKFSNVNIAENVAIDWETINKTQKGNFKIYEISAHEKAVSTLESNFLENHLKYQIVTIESEGKLYSYFLEVYTTKGSNAYPETITKLNDFTGTLNVFLLNGENLGSVAIYNGKARNVSKIDDLNVLAESINAFSTKSDATNKIPQCGGNYTVIIDQTLSRFDVWTVGDKIVAVNYLGTTTTRTTTILPFPCDGSYGKEDILNQRLEMYNYKEGSGGGNNPGINLMPPPPDIPIADIKKFLSCLNTSASANLTVFAERMGNENGVGHAFISISQGNNTMVFGYYPKNSGINSLTGQGIMGENGGHHYDVSANMGQISPQQLEKIISLSVDYQNRNYDLGFNNCSDFATNVLNITGVSTSSWVDTPNTVADILATLANHTIKSNYAPKTQRTCP